MMVEPKVSFYRRGRGGEGMGGEGREGKGEEGSWVELRGA